MKKYQIFETLDGGYHAGTKANGDISVIAEKLGYEKVIVRQISQKEGVLAKAQRQITWRKDFQAAYNKIEKVKDIYIGLNTNNKWVILSGDTSVTYDEKIQGYNNNKMYYKTKGTSYHVYDEYGNKISKDDFEYVELYNDFYAGVINKEVFIYDYDGNKISTKGVKVSNTDYARVENPSFYAKRTDGKYYVYVYDGKEYTMNPTFETEVHGGSQKPEPEPETP